MAASRIWTKGVTWKKTAIKLLSETSNFSSTSTESEQKAFFNATYNPASSHVEYLQCLSGYGAKKHFTLQNISKNFIAGFGSQNSQHNLLETFEHFKPSADSKSLMNGSLHSWNLDIRRCFGTTSRNSGAEGGKDPQKSQIISSMFEKEGQNQTFAQTEEEPPKDKPDDDKEKKTESPFMRSQRYAKWMLLISFGISTPLLIWEFGPPHRDELGNVIEDEFSNLPIVVAYTKRAWSAVKLVEKDIVEPSSQKLLPDPLQEPYYQPPYTLVIELFDVLLHPVYDQVHGWRFKKRPGIDYFLATVGPPLYEIVIFTRETGMTAYPLIDSMDPKGYIMYRLFRDAARFKSGFKMGNIMKGEFPKLDPYYQKDVTYLNRDLKRVVVVDNDKRATELQPSNGISLKPWDGSNTDTELFDLAAFLRTLATNEVDDVRPVLEHYRNYEDPLAAFKLAQARALEEQKKIEKQMKERKNTSFMLNPSSGGGLSMLTNFFRPRS